jgi:hypothetical protein
MALIIVKSALVILSQSPLNSAIHPAVRISKNEARRSTASPLTRVAFCRQSSGCDGIGYAIRSRYVVSIVAEIMSIDDVDEHDPG